MAPAAALKPKPAGQPLTLAYVTFLPRGGDDVKGIVGLVKGLRNVESKYPLLVAVLPDVPEKDRQILVKQGCIVREIEPVDLPKNRTQFAMGYDAINYSKLRIWEFVEYNKMIYLNGDIQVYANIDHLFDRPNGRFYAVMDCFCEKTWSHTLQYEIGYCPQCPDRAPWPKAEKRPCPAQYFNAGMFVFEPNLPKYTYRDLLKTLKDTPPMPFADQDFLNKCFQNIYSPLKPFYNLSVAMLWRHPEKIELDKVKVAHSSAAGGERWRYTRTKENIDPEYMKRMEKCFKRVKVVRYCAAGSNPWSYNKKEENMDREDIKMLVVKWLDIYDNVSLNYKNCAVPAAEAKAKPVNLQPFP